MTYNKAFTISSDHKFNHCHSVVFMPNKTFYAVWSQGDETEDSTTNRIVGTSSPNGVQWETPCFIAGIPEANNLNPALLQDGTRTWLFWNDVTHKNSFTCYTDDFGKTWSKPEERSEFESCWALRANGIVLSHGRLVLPCYSPQFKAAVLYSDDHGKRWHLSTLVPSKSVVEPTIIEKADRSLLMYLRKVPRGPLSQAISEDGGLSWSPASDLSNIKSPSAPPFLYKMKNGNLAFIHNNSHKFRSPLVYRCSNDDGMTWSEPVDIDRASGKQNFVDYASCTEGKDNDFLIIYSKYYWRGGKLLGMLLGRKMDTKGYMIKINNGSCKI